MCGTRTKGRYPEGLEPTRTFGPGAEALLAYLHDRHHLGCERLVEVCDELIGLAISEGAIANALTRLAARARPTYEAIGAEVRAGPVIGSDETSARVNARPAQQRGPPQGHRWLPLRLGRRGLRDLHHAPDHRPQAATEPLRRPPCHGRTVTSRRRRPAKLSNYLQGIQTSTTSSSCIGGSPAGR
jgi:hypothetical protein